MSDEKTTFTSYYRANSGVCDEIRAAPRVEVIPSLFDPPIKRPAKNAFLDLSYFN